MINVLSLISAACVTTSVPNNANLSSLMNVYEYTNVNNSLTTCVEDLTPLELLAFQREPLRTNHSDEVSETINSPYKHLRNNYPQYTWIQNDNACGITSKQFSNIETDMLPSDYVEPLPIEMKSNDFSVNDIKDALISSGAINYTTYGGCGPIAMIGMLEYFSRCFGYREIINEPTSKNDRIALAEEVFRAVDYENSSFGDGETLIWPWQCVWAFNTVLANHGLKDLFTLDLHISLVGGEKNTIWDIIVENVNKGMPVTLFTGMDSGDGDFGGHYTNIYGYETWIGINNGDRLIKQFIKARTNLGNKNDCYCDAEILDCAQIGVITYSINYSKSQDLCSFDFLSFMNGNGQGQYFYYPIQNRVRLLDGTYVYTERLRTSVIENEYLVLSPNKKNAGEAYLDITFPHDLQKFSFSLSMWGPLEDCGVEDFYVQYWRNGKWENHTIIHARKLGTDKSHPDFYNMIFPKGVDRIKFYAKHNNPAGNRNKGRICIDNMVTMYN